MRRAATLGRGEGQEEETENWGWGRGRGRPGTETETETESGRKTTGKRRSSWEFGATVSRG
jgi:hypothetical protein